MLFGGTADRDDLNYWSTLAGDRDEPITTTDMNGRVASRTTRRVPVLAAAQLANLRAGRVVVFRRDMPPVVGRVEQAWRRRDVHSFHHPDALTVKARAWRNRQLAIAGRWVECRTRPARVWLVARWATVATFADALGATIRRQWVALRFRVTGHGGPTGYVAPSVVPVPVTAPVLPPSVPGGGTGLPDGSGGGDVIPFPSPWTRPAHLDNRDPRGDGGTADLRGDEGRWP